MASARDEFIADSLAEVSTSSLCLSILGMVSGLVAGGWLASVVKLAIEPLVMIMVEPISCRFGLDVVVDFYGDETDA